MKNGEFIKKVLSALLYGPPYGGKRLYLWEAANFEDNNLHSWCCTLLQTILCVSCFTEECNFLNRSVFIQPFLVGEGVPEYSLTIR